MAWAGLLALVLVLLVLRQNLVVLLGTATAYAYLVFGGGRLTDIVVDIWDAATRELVWRGTVTDVMPSSGDQEKIEKLVAKAISKLADEGRELWEKEVDRRADAARDAAREAERANR